MPAKGAGFLGMLASLVLASSAWAGGEEAAPNWKDDTLTGDWGGARQSWYEKGVEIGLTHKSDVLANVSGGLKHGAAWLGHTEARVKLDLGKLAGWENTTAYIQYHSQLGSKFNAHYVGSYMGVDNIEVAANTGQFFQAWLQKNSADGRFSVLGGLYAVDSEFYVTETSGLFLQPTYGMANDLAQTGVSGPPIFPKGALAVRLKAVSPGGDFYAQGAVADGVPGDPANPYGTHIQLGRGDGSLQIVELGYTPQGGAEGAVNKIAIGFWRYTALFDDLEDVDASGNPVRRPSHGAYFLAERSLYREAAHPERGLAGFARFGTAGRDLYQGDWTGSLGLRYRGLLAGRGDDVAGIALTVNHASDKYRRLNASDEKETLWELTYRVQVNGWLAVQPDVQYIINPGMDKSIRDAWVVGARVEMAL